MNKTDFEQSRLDELGKGDRSTVETYVKSYIQHCSHARTTYSLKQKMTRETGVYIFQKDMYLLMESLGYKVFIDSKGNHHAYAKYM